MYFTIIANTWTEFLSPWVKSICYTVIIIISWNILLNLCHDDNINVYTLIMLLETCMLRYEIKIWIWKQKQKPLFLPAVKASHFVALVSHTRTYIYIYILICLNLIELYLILMFCQQWQLGKVKALIILWRRTEDA